MLIVLSPAKTLDYESTLKPLDPLTATQPEFVERSARLIRALRKLKPPQLSELMGISGKLAELNAARYKAWSSEFTQENSRPAALAFNGDVYEGLDARSLTIRQLEFAQQHVRILSGLYGVLKPLDLMQPYRLEMGTAIGSGKAPDLYSYWGKTVTGYLNAQLAEENEPVLVNLASEEYFKVVRTDLLKARVVVPVFEDYKNGRYKIISFFAKKARGSMTRWAIVHRVANVEKLKGFDSAGYAFAPKASDESRWVFRRNLGAQAGLEGAR